MGAVSRKRRQDGHCIYIAHWIVFVSKWMLAISTGTKHFDAELSSHTSHPTMNSTPKPIPSCDGSFWVESTAKMISIPSTNSSTSVSCKWLLKAKDKHNTIALSTVNVTMNLDHPHIYLRLEARDGWKDDSPLIGYVEVTNEGFKELDWKFLHPVKAKSGFLLLKFQNEGYDPLLVDFVYYTCGGLTNSRTYISSPVFEELPLLPNTIDCQWEFAKPADALYGYFKPIRMNVSDCTVLHMRSNSTMWVIENVAEEGSRKDWKKPNRAFNGTYLQLFEWINRNNITSAAQKPKPKNRTVVRVCGNSIRLVAFDSDTAKLRYFSSTPQRGVGFKALYSIFKVPSFESPSTGLPWYFNYCALTIFTPIGVFVGGVIIIYQTRRKYRGRSSQVAVTKLFDSPKEGGMPGHRPASFRSERSFRLGGFLKDKPPARRTKSLNNIKLFNFSPMRIRSKAFSAKEEDVVEEKEDSRLQEREYSRNENTKVTTASCRDQPPLSSNLSAIGRRLSKSSEYFTNVCNTSVPNPPPLKNPDKKRVTFCRVAEVTNGTQTL